MSRKIFSGSIIISLLSFGLFSCFGNNFTVVPTPTPTISATLKPASIGSPSGINVTEFLWTKFNLKFNLPSDMKQTKNEDTEFKAENEAIVFDLLPWATPKLTQDDVIIEGIKSLNLDKDSLKVISQPTGQITINSFSGVSVGATATISNVPVTIGIIGLSDGASGYIGYVTFINSKSSEQDKNINIFADIFNTINKVVVATPTPSAVEPSPSPSSS